MIKSFKSKYGDDKIKLDTINKRIKINNNSQMISVYDKKLEMWKYLEFNPQIITKVYGTETSIELEKYVR